MARILVIDDQEDLRRLFRHALEAAGHVVFEAGDGDLGIAAFRQQPVDIVLCDIFMPGREGLDTIRELSRCRPAPSIVAMSGGSDLVSGDFLRTAHLFGAALTLQKPFSMAELIQVIQKLEPLRSTSPQGT